MTVTTIAQMQKAPVISDGALVSIIEDQERIRGSISLADISSTDCLAGENQSAYGKTDVFPTPVHKAKASGILPLSAAKFNDLNRRRKSSNTIKKYMKLRNLTLSDTEGYRIRTAYRLIRYLARVRGDIPGYSMISQALSHKWDKPTKYNPNEGYSTGVKGIKTILNNWQNSNNTFTYFDGAEYITTRGVTYLPPPIPDKFYIESGAESYEDIWHMRVHRIVPQSYLHEEDQNLSYFCDIMDLLSERLSIIEGTDIEPEAGLYGMVGMLNNASARIAWPTPDELEMYEESMCWYIYDLIIENPDRGECERLIMREFGLERNEAMDYYLMSRDFGVNAYREDAEKTRGLLIDRIGRVAQEARGEDLRCELAAFKEQASLKGLKKNEESNEMQELRAMAVRAGEYNELEE